MTTFQLFFSSLSLLSLSFSLFFFFLSFPGSLSILKALDREEQDTFNLTIVAEDHGTPQHSTTQVLSVQVIDVNDEPPLFEKSQFEAQIRENQEPGSTVLTVSATDRDQGDLNVLRDLDLDLLCRLKSSPTVDKHFSSVQSYLVRL